ncbi:hypothetical protein EDD18DRAFT_1347434 [Armillaria luteobubalina]|uniref:Uncharacterized protein n=1 Tax=Armillaria luteobubalina TaxID=153913 RepID=A0AA39QEB5_9AGAR|nr:hypothetical protein EDD18DRAFT_1347434 [Armillaria luteobubalina]
MTEGNMDFPYWLLRLAKRCVAAGCPHFTLEVEEGHYGNFFNPFESCVQDGRICIIKKDCGGLIIEQDEEESEEWPGWGDGEARPEDEVEDLDDGWDDIWGDSGWGDGLGDSGWGEGWGESGWGDGMRDREEYPFDVWPV